MMTCCLLTYFFDIQFKKIKNLDDLEKYRWPTLQIPLFPNPYSRLMGWISPAHGKEVGSMRFYNSRFFLMSTLKNLTCFVFIGLPCKINVST